MNPIITFIFGAMMGSAANALIDRLPRKESWFTGRSHCDKCNHVLEWYDLIPIISFLSLGGKCRYCRSPIPYRNVLIELFLAIGFGFIIYHLSFNIFQAVLLTGILWVTTIIAVMDWETRLVSEAAVALWATLVVSYQLAVGSLIWENLMVGLLIGMGVIGGIWAVSRGKAMGFGDVEIAAVMGWWIGFPNVVVALWVAFVSGAIIGIWQLAFGKAKMKSEIAFGPFLILGSWVGYLWGDLIWHAIGIQ